MSKLSPAITKSEFAELCSVSRGRVSQWIKAGLISGKAFVGEGRRAKINPEIARRQLRERLSVGQLFGNGADTKLSPSSARGVGRSTADAARLTYEFPERADF